MINYNSPVIQSTMANGSNYGNPAAQNSMYSQFDDTVYYTPPVMPPAYNPNNAYYAAQQLNMGYQQPMYGQPQLNNYYYQPQQQMRQPWQLIQTPVQYQQQNSGPVNPFVQNSYGYSTQYQQQDQQVPSTYIEKGFNPTGLDAMYSDEMNKQLKELNEKYSRLNGEKARERRYAYSNFGYNYYGGMNMGYRDPVLLSEFNREKAKIEARAKENLNEFNMQISRAVHYYRGDIDMDNTEELEKVKDIYRDKVVSVPQTFISDSADVRRHEKAYDITERCKWEVNEIDRKVSEEYHKKLKPDATFDEFLNTAGLVLWDISMEEMEKRHKAQNDRYSYDKLKSELDRNLFIRDGYNSPREIDPSEPFRALENSGLLTETPGVHMDFDTGTITLDRDEWKKHRDRINVLSNQEQMDYEQQRQMFINSVYNSNIL